MSKWLDKLNQNAETLTYAGMGLLVTACSVMALMSGSDKPVDTPLEAFTRDNVQKTFVTRDFSMSDSQLSLDSLAKKYNAKVLEAKDFTVTRHDSIFAGTTIAMKTAKTGDAQYKVAESRFAKMDQRDSGGKGAMPVPRALKNKAARTISPY